MLIVVSDIHLWDGTIGLPVTPQTFSLFASRVRELAFQASWRSDGSYRPIESVDILLLGDILDPLQSTRWQDDTQGFIRPWSEVSDPLFAQKLAEITRAILENNSHAVGIFKSLARGEAIRIPPDTIRGKPDFYTLERFSPKVRIHYLVGNHDWYYRLPGPAFDAIRREIVEAMGLSNGSRPFPHDPGESGLLTGLLMDYEIVARHGDIFDRFTYNHQLGRNAAALSDIYSSEVIFRFTREIEKQLQGQISPALLAATHQITNVRPLLAAPIWLHNQVRSSTTPLSMENKFKSIWNSVIDDFLKLDAVHTRLDQLRGGELNALRLLLMVTQRTSFQQLADVTNWMQKKMLGSERSIARFAQQERDILENRASFVVYGHTHSLEVISLDKANPQANLASRAYINTGSWGTYYDVAAPAYNRSERSTSNLVTCVAFYKDDERKGRKFEPWWANFA